MIFTHRRESNNYYISRVELTWSNWKKKTPYSPDLELHHCSHFRTHLLSVEDLALYWGYGEFYRPPTG